MEAWTPMARLLSRGNRPIPGRERECALYGETPVIALPPIVACRSPGSGQWGAALHREAAKIKVSAGQRILALCHQ